MYAFVRGLLLAAGVVTSATSLTAQVQNDDATDLEEGPIAQISARLAYNSEDEGVVGVGLRTDRLFGLNQSLSLDAEATADGTRLTFNYLNDAISGGTPRFGLRLFRNDRRAGDVYPFDSTVTGIVPRLTWPLGENGSLSAFAMYTLGEIDNLGPSPSALISADAGTQRSTAIGTEISLRFPGTGGARRDTRLGFEFAGGRTSHDHEYLRYAARLAMLHAVADGNVVLRTQLRAGAIETLSGTSSIGDRYMLGDASIRGFAFGGFGPRDEAAGDVALGGNRYAVLRLDAQFPNAITAAEGRFVPGIFLDAGSLWGLDDVNGGPLGTDPVDDDARLRAAVGLSLRIRTGIGPVEIYAAHPFERADYDQRQHFGLTFSHRF
jgi:outer membrane protein insertion porin family